MGQTRRDGVFYALWRFASWRKSDRPVWDSFFFVGVTVVVETTGCRHEPVVGRVATGIGGVVVTEGKVLTGVRTGCVGTDGSTTTGGTLTAEGGPWFGSGGCRTATSTGKSAEERSTSAVVEVELDDSAVAVRSVVDCEGQPVG